MLDIASLRDAYRELLDAAAVVGDSSAAPPAGEWNADQILAHVAIVTAVTIGAASAVASGASATYDNRMALDSWTIDRLVARAGGNSGLRDRVRSQGDSLTPWCPRCCCPTTPSWSTS
jgi:predicted TIM-barrel enzyme